MAIVQFLFHTILLSWPIYALTQNQTIAKNGCRDHCGNVSIPYPFGIGANCSLDNSFEIGCYANLNSSIPSLKNLFTMDYYVNFTTLTNMEVREISVTGTIHLSPTKLSMICNRSESECPFWATEGSQNLSIEVPVVIEWGLYNHTVYDLGMDYSTANTSNSSCITSNWNATTQTRKLTCYCQPGYDGNPYLLHGCQDIDECQDKLRIPCSDGSNKSYQCINFPGGYGCFEPALPKESKSKMIAIGICTGVVGLLFLLVGLWWLYKVIKKRKDIKLKQKFFKRNGGLLLQQQLSSGEVNVDKIKMFNSNELEKATEHFNVDRMLGQGGQGTVYKGMITDGRIVAVKKSKVVDEGKLEQFINEVVILSQINHRNVVKILGCCLETEVPLLVYEFIPNGTLFQYLHEQNEEFPLTWDLRLRIAKEVAGALFYLHYAASLPIYHRDVKSSNILLDDKYRAKVADFGTSRSVAIDQTHVTTLIQGTFGYLDPEYFQSSQFTEKSDVYSFGVVLVELLTGQKPISSTRIQARSLATYFILLMEENSLCDILDAQVMKEDRNEEVMVVAKLAERCLNLNGKKRPTMKEVTMELEGIQKSQKDLIDSQNSEEVKYVRTEMVEPWDVASTSTRSGLDSGIGSSLDTIPLFSTK